jgi:signal transduction histidine kinase
LPILAAVADPGSASRANALFWVGAATACIAELPFWLALARRPGLLATPRHAAWLGLFLLFLAAFVAVARRPLGTRHRGALALVGLQSLAAVGLAALQHNFLTSVLLVMVAAQLAAVVPLGLGLLWVLAQTSAFGAALIQPDQLLDGVLSTAVFAGFQLFAFYTFRIAASERQARAELARAHESLLATRRLLAETTRTGERLRIARELHDVLGHHLTALSLHLEAALHAPEGAARERVQRARDLVRGLLREVRVVVSTLRQGDSEAAAGIELRLTAALASLSAGAEEPVLHWNVQTGGELDGMDLTHAVLRCAQEAYTNAVRHSGARNLWLDVEDGGGAITFRARDDGRGTAEVQPGNGLRGMRERIEKLGGRLEVASAPGEGFTVTARIPRPGGG